MSKAKKLTSEQNQEDWMNSKWRPAMGWMYMMVCIFDFIIFPILWAVVQFWENQVANDAFRQWSPLTLQGAGLFHMAMGAVLGVAAWSRGQEKIAGTSMTPTSIAPPMPHTPSPVSAAPSMIPRPMAPSNDLPDDPPMRNTRND